MTTFLNKIIPLNLGIDYLENKMLASRFSFKLGEQVSPISEHFASCLC